MKPLNEMHAGLITYFSGEKRESLLFLLVGAAAIAASVILWKAASPYRGMTYPLIAIALIQLVVGGTVYVRTDGQVRALHKQLAGDPPAYAAAELSRMATVQRSFKIYKGIEIALLALGIAGSFVFRERETLYAASIGLILQSALMLALDLVAERRADVYVERIRTLVDGAG